MRKQFTSILFAGGLCLSSLGQQASPPADAQAGNNTNPMQRNEIVDSSMKPMVTLAAQMNVFRLSAGFNAERAIEVWANPAFQAKWQREVRPLFPVKPDRQQIHDFFSSAVVLLGRAGEGRGVAGFYNPWMDGLLLVAAAPGQEHPILEDFCFIAGETWRGETVKTGEDVLALYMLKEPLTITLARKYAATIEKFNRLYPASAAFLFLPEEAKHGVGPTGEELGPIKGRMLYRAKMFRALFEKENARVVQVAKELRALLPEGDVAKLRAYLSPRQNVEMLETIGRMPALLRRNLAPNYFVRNPAAGGSVMALVNSEMPRWVFVVQVLEQGTNTAPAVTIEAMDLESSAKILANIRK